MGSVVKELKALSEKYNLIVDFERIPRAEKKIAYCSGPFIVTLDSSLKKIRSEALCAFFHELGHAICYRKGLWKSYHNYEPALTNNKRILRSLIYTSLKAERWVDNFAAKELAKYDKRIKYDFPYSQDKRIQFFHELYIKPAKIKVDKKKK